MIFYSNIFSLLIKIHSRIARIFLCRVIRYLNYITLKNYLLESDSKKDLRLRRISRRHYETLRNNQILQKIYGKNLFYSMTIQKYESQDSGTTRFFFFGSDSNAWIKIDKQRESRSLIHDSICFRYMILYNKYAKYSVVLTVLTR